MAAHRYRAPTAAGAVLAEPGFDALPALVEANRTLLDRTDVVIGGLPLRDLRALARREAVERAGASNRGSTDGPFVLAGHQPELAHPGVWVKNFALNRLARELGGVPLNLVVDNDTLKTTSLRFPTFRDRDPRTVRLESVAFDTFGGEVPYEDRGIEDGDRTGAFDSFAARAEPLWRGWGYLPLLPNVWADIVHHTPTATIGERFAAARSRYERAWGCDNLELPVSRLARTDSFGRFAAHIRADLPRFRAVYNAAVRAYRRANGVRSANHPAPDLAAGELPFWVRTTTGRRARATASSDVRALRPRAFTLTLFARVCLGDFFIHGIGGGKYDEVTDALIRDYFGIDPPAYQVLSATLHLPLPGFPSTANDLTRAARRVRDLRWNPWRDLSAEHRANPDVAALADAHAALAANEPPPAHHTARRDRFRALQALTDRLRPFVTAQVPGAEAELARVRSEVDANAILRRRDYSWVLYPEDVLRPFLQRFLEARAKHQGLTTPGYEQSPFQG